MAGLKAVIDELLRSLPVLDDKKHEYVYRVYMQPTVKSARIYRIRNQTVRSLPRDQLPGYGNYILVGLHRSTKQAILTYRSHLDGDVIETHTELMYDDNDLKTACENASTFLIRGTVPRAAENNNKETTHDSN